MSRVTFLQAVARLDERGIEHSGVKDRGFMDSIYFRDPLGSSVRALLLPLRPPAGMTHVDVLLEAHKLRVARKDHNIAEVHLADAIEKLTRERRESLSKTVRRRIPTPPGLQRRGRRRKAARPGNARRGREAAPRRRDIRRSRPSDNPAEVPPKRREVRR